MCALNREWQWKVLMFLGAAGRRGGSGGMAELQRWTGRQK